MKYQTLNTEFIYKFWRLLDEKARHGVKRYGDKCPKEIFVERTLNKWFSNNFICFIKHKNTDVEGNIKYPVKVKVYAALGRIEYAMSFGEQITLYYGDAADMTILGLNSIFLDSYSSREFEFIKSSKEEFIKVKSLFLDDREDNEYTFVGYEKNMKMKESTLTLTGKSRREAAENYKGDLWIDQ